MGLVLSLYLLKHCQGIPEINVTPHIFLLSTFNLKIYAVRALHQFPFLMRLFAAFTVHLHILKYFGGLQFLL